MKKYVMLLMALSCFGFSVNAQKVKIKKGEIQLDGTSVAKMEKVTGSDNSEYRFSDLNGTVLFNATLSGKTPEGNSLPDKILMLTAPNGNVKEILTKDIKISFTLSIEKGMCDYVLNCGANLITHQGVDLQKVNEYFQTSDRSITSAIDEQMRPIRDAMKEEDAQAVADGIKILSNDIMNGTIMKGDVKIGFIGVRNNEKTSKMQYLIIDKDGDYVGKTDIPNIATGTRSTPVMENYTLTTFDGKELPFFATFYPQKASIKDDVADRMLKKLYYSGYKFDELSVKEMAKANSNNVYDVHGYVIDKNGDKIEGLVTIEYKSLDELMGKGQIGLVLDVTNYGSSADIKTTDGKTKTYKAKDRITVVAGDRKFVGLPSAALDGSKLYEVVAEKDGNMVLYSINYNEYSLKMANQDKTKLFSSDGVLGKKKPEQIQKEFVEYVGLNVADYQTETKDGLIKLIEDYANKCK